MSAVSKTRTMSAKTDLSGGEARTLRVPCSRRENVVMRGRWMYKETRDSHLYVFPLDKTSKRTPVS